MISCTFEDNGTGLLRHVTVCGVIMYDNKVLLARRGTFDGGKPLLESGKWGLTGGFVGRDESVTEALKREAQEEIGIKIDNLQLLHVKDNPDRPHEDRQNIEFVFAASTQDIHITTNEETTNIEWFALDNLPLSEECAFDHYDSIMVYRDFLKGKVALPVFGKYSY